MNVEATISLDQAAVHSWDAVVIGAGPAGAVSARALARVGLDVLLVDKAVFPRWKVCGSCLNQAGQGALAKVGLGDLPARLGAVDLDSMELHSPGRKVRLNLAGVKAISREGLDAALVQEAIKMGVHFLPSTQAHLGPMRGEWRDVKLRQGERLLAVTSRLALAADGLGGRTVAEEPGLAVNILSGSRLGAGAIAPVEAAPDYAPGHLYMICGAGGYLGLVRLEDGRLDLAAALDPDFIREAGGMGHAAARLLADASMPPVADVVGLVWRGTPPLTRTINRPAAHRLLVLGDASGYVEPFTGEGMAWAMTQAVEAAGIAEEGVHRWRPDLEAEWAKRHHALMAPRMKTCRAITSLLHQPKLIGPALAILGVFPSLAESLARRLTAASKAERETCQFQERLTP